ncbi:type II toxin-antitoxin system death-on-curing family toxin [bacterium]|nr:MAG: type II toxin-antitoxin system death-on-curing family toxin [bacterium]
MEYIADVIGRKLDTEPIPKFNEVARKRFDSCLQQIKLPYYDSLLNKSANLFYMISKNHPLENGNKRMAVTCLVIFLALNGHRLVIKPMAMVKLARWVVQTDTASKDAVHDLPPDFMVNS